MTAICESCRTSNRPGAQYCHGCGGKLPAFYAAAGRVTRPATLDPLPAPASPPLSGPLSTARESRSSWRRKTLIAWVGILLGMACVALWYVGYAGYAASKSAPAAPATPSSSRDLASSTHSAEQQRTAATLSAGAAALELLQSPPRDIPQPAPPPVNPAQRAPPKAPPTVRPVSANPVAQCAGLNFFARAICVNNVCAQAASASHPRCIDARHQRQLDEARRNLPN